MIFFSFESFVTYNIIYIVKIVAHMFSYSNSAVNPFIYAFMSNDFRRSFKETFASCFCCKKYLQQFRRYSTPSQIHKWQYVSLPPANEVLGKVMFLHLCVILFTGEGLASQHASQVTWLGGLPPGGLPTGGSAPRGVGRPPLPDTWDTTGYSQQALKNIFQMLS